MVLPPPACYILICFKSTIYQSLWEMLYESVQLCIGTGKLMRESLEEITKTRYGLFMLMVCSPR